jgi:outer membrane protein assembly factor BamB
VVSQTAKISGAGFNPSFATVGVDAAGNVGIVAVSSTASTNLSLLLWRKSDPPNTFNGPITIVAGTQPYTCLNTNNMATIGNAAGVLTALDPLDGTKLWTTQQWSNDAARCVWNTRIVEYEVVPQAGPVKQSKPKVGKRP